MVTRNESPRDPEPALRLVGSAPEGLEGREDDELVLLAAAGSRPAFAALARRHTARLVSFCIRLVGDAGAGEELAQEVWLEIWKHRQDYRPGAFRAFLYTIARNRGRNHLRGRRRWSRVEPEVTTLGELERSATDGEHLERLLQAERERRLTVALGKLSVDYREAVLLRFSEELDYDSIGAILRIPVSTARSRVFHALRQLRRLLSAEVWR